MRLIKPYYEIIEQSPELGGLYSHIELCGRVCYKSEDKITEDSSKTFVDRLIKSGHTSVLEHGTVYLTLIYEGSNIHQANVLYSRYGDNRFSKVFFIDERAIGGKYLGRTCYVTTNYRVLLENNWLDDLKYQCEPTKYHEKRYSVRFICDRGISHELVRHRVFSFSQESTRYCNYSKDKFGEELTFIIPSWLSSMNEGYYYWEDPNPLVTAGKDVRDVGWDDSSKLYCRPIESQKNELFEVKRHYPEWLVTEDYMESLQKNEDIYLSLIQQKWVPQQARSVLPNSLKTELIMTGFAKDWEHFFKLRDSNAAHPQAYELAHPLHEEFIKRGYING